MDVVYYSDSKKMRLKIERGSPRGRECSAIRRGNPPGWLKKHTNTQLKSIKTGLGVYVKLKKHTKTQLKPTNSPGESTWWIYVKLKKHTKTQLKSIKTGLGDHEKSIKIDENHENQLKSMKINENHRFGCTGADWGAF